MVKSILNQMFDVCVRFCLGIALIGNCSIALAQDGAVGGDVSMQTALAERGELILDDDGIHDRGIRPK
jgi:hypothetical protein